MRCRCESLEAWTTCERRVSLPHDTSEILKKQRAADNARRRLDGETDREVRLTAVEQRDSFVSSEHPADAHVDVRSALQADSFDPATATRRTPRSRSSRA